MVMPMLNIVDADEALPQLAFLPEMILPNLDNPRASKSTLLKQCAKLLNCHIDKILIIRPQILHAQPNQNRVFHFELIHHWDPSFIFHLKSTKQAAFCPDDKIWTYTPRPLGHGAEDLGNAVLNSNLEYVCFFSSNGIAVYQNPHC